MTDTRFDPNYKTWLDASWHTDAKGAFCGTIRIDWPQTHKQDTANRPHSLLTPTSACLPHLLVHRWWSVSAKQQHAQSKLCGTIIIIASGTVADWRDTSMLARMVQDNGAWCVRAKGPWIGTWRQSAGGWPVNRRMMMNRQTGSSTKRLNLEFFIYWHVT